MNTLAIYGDSISSKTRDDGGYAEIIKNACNLDKVFNHAVSGSGLTTITPNNFFSVISDLQNQHQDANAIILWYGTNDWYWGTSIGKIESNNAKEFCGAVNLAIEKLKTINPNIKIIWPGPIYRFEAPDFSDKKANAWISQNKSGAVLKDFDDAIKALSVIHGFTYLDMYRKTGIDEKTSDFYLEDGVHPNKEGYIKISELLIEALKTTCSLVK